MLMCWLGALISMTLIEQLWIYYDDQKLTIHQDMCQVRCTKCSVCKYFAAPHDRDLELDINHWQYRKTTWEKLLLFVFVFSCSLKINNLIKSIFEIIICLPIMPKESLVKFFKLI